MYVIKVQLKVGAERRFPVALLKSWTLRSNSLSFIESELKIESASYGDLLIYEKLRMIPKD